MGWSEYTTFTIEDNEENIRKIRNALRDGDSLPESFKKYRLHFCEFASRLGAITIKELINLYDLADKAKPEDENKIKKLFKDKSLPYNCTTVELVECYDATIVFEMKIFKNSYYYECNALLKKLFPKAKITYSTFDTIEEF